MLTRSSFALALLAIATSLERVDAQLPVKSPRFAAGNTETELAHAKKAVAPRNGACAGDWVADAGQADYTRPTDGSQAVSLNYQGPTDVRIGDTRTQEWTTTIGAALSFTDILSLGISFSSAMLESVSDSDATLYHIDEGKFGFIAWTPFLRCSQGSGTCNGAHVSGEVCTPYLSGNDSKLAGVFSLVQTT